LLYLPLLADEKSSCLAVAGVRLQLVLVAPSSLPLLLCVPEGGSDLEKEGVLVLSHGSGMRGCGGERRDGGLREEQPVRVQEM
jgi:hypothetical protein